MKVEDVEEIELGKAVKSSKCNPNKILGDQQHRLNNEVREELRNMHVDGFSNIFSDSNVTGMKIVWICVLIASSASCVFLIVKTVEEYMRFEVTTKIRVLTGQEAVFPTITICNLNPFTTPYADELFSAANITNDPNNIWLLDEYMKQTTGSYLSNAQKERMSSLDDMLVGCKFSFDSCSSSQFQFVYHPLYMNCYRFNSGFNASQQSTELNKIVSAGIVNSLTIDLYSGLSDSQNYADNMLFKVSTKSYKYYIFSIYFIVFDQFWL